MSKSWTARDWLNVAIVAAGITVVSVWVYNVQADARDDVHGDNPISASKACEALVEAQLKAPSTAEFNSDAQGGNGTWRVRGTVDAENSFGAQVRSEYACDVTVTHSGVDATLTMLG